MDMGTGIIGLAFLLICIALFYILSRGNQKREKQLLKSITDLAAANNAKITLHDTWNNAAIGIDMIAKKLFITANANVRQIHHHINLAEVQRCNVNRVERSVGSKEAADRIIEKIELVFTYYERKKTDNVVVFYDTRFDSSSLSDEIQLLEKWCKVINEECKEAAAFK